MSQPTPSEAEFRAGVLAYREREGRDAVYNLATFLVEHFWEDSHKLADSVGVLLLVWNQAHYRYGPPDFGHLEEFLVRHGRLLEDTRHREIGTFSPADHRLLETLFTSALGALEIRRGDGAVRKSPVAVAKALHMLAPAFFPLWDKKIADAYGCAYADAPTARYLEFILLQKSLVSELSEVIESLSAEKTALKVLDEFNYARFTKGWA